MVFPALEELQDPPVPQARLARPVVVADGLAVKRSDTTSNGMVFWNYLRAKTYRTSTQYQTILSTTQMYPDGTPDPNPLESSDPKPDWRGLGFLTNPDRFGSGSRAVNEHGASGYRYIYIYIYDHPDAPGPYGFEGPKGCERSV